MLYRPRLIVAVSVAALLLMPLAGHAQLGPSGGGGFGGSGNNYGGPHAAVQNLESLEKAGPDRKAKNDSELIKEAKRKITDADPRVRVDGLEKLRYVSDSAEANELLFRGLNDADVRVRIKAIDVLGARASNDAVPIMNQDLFLRETPAVEKLHLVAALGRVGDSRGALPIIEYLDQTDDTASRGTAVFALGEIGDPRANDKLIQIVQTDKSAMVRKLAEEALEKIDGEIPNRHQEDLEQAKAKQLETTDQKLAKLRQYDSENQAEKYGRSTN
jgi:HEAT repeat protein